MIALDQQNKEIFIKSQKNFQYVLKDLKEQFYN